MTMENSREQYYKTVTIWFEIWFLRPDQMMVIELECCVYDGLSGFI